MFKTTHWRIRSRLFSRLRVKAFISHNIQSQRYIWSEQIVRSCGLSLTHVPIFTYHQPSDRRLAEQLFFSGNRTGHLPLHETVWGRLTSCTLSHIRAWDLLASQSKYDWGIVFEDDIDLHPNISGKAAASYIDSSLKLAMSLGHPLVYLGLCNPICPNETISIPIGRKVPWRPTYRFGCHGLCTHAYAIQRSYAEHFWTTIQDYQYNNLCAIDQMPPRRVTQICWSPRADALQRWCCRTRFPRNIQMRKQWVPRNKSWGPDVWMSNYFGTYGAAYVHVPDDVPYHRSLRAGLGLFHQSRRTFPSLTAAGMTD